VFSSVYLIKSEKLEMRITHKSVCKKKTQKDNDGF